MTLTPEGYRPRLIDGDIEQMLNTFGAVKIEGPKWSGKTWTAENHANSEIKVAEMTGPVRNRDLIASDLRKALTGSAPHLIDEWQEVPELHDAVRAEVDRNPAKGRFILTGSSVPYRDSYLHSGAGRIGTANMRTMSLFETGDSDGSIPLGDILDCRVTAAECRVAGLDRLIDLCVRGGWPGSVGTANPGLIPRQYLALAAEDAVRMDGKRRNLNKMTMLLRSLARNESTMVSDAALMKDMKRFDDENIAVETYYDYTDCLNRIHLLDEVSSFRPNVRSEVRVGKSPKRHLTDVSLAIAALDLNRTKLKNDLRTFGFMFEALCEHDLRIYAEHLGGRMYHYRDGRDREIDAVVELPDGRWGAFEIKLGTDQVDEAAGKLLKLRNFFAGEGTVPCSLCVLSGMSDFAYTRPDGVSVVPIASLGP